MMGDRTVMQEALFYSFSLEDHVPQHHLLRAVDRFVHLDGIREKLRPFYSETGRPSIDPELMIRMLLIGYCLGIRSERRLCEPIAGFAVSASTGPCLITRPSRRTGTAALNREWDSETRSLLTAHCTTLPYIYRWSGERCLWRRIYSVFSVA